MSILKENEISDQQAQKVRVFLSSEEEIQPTVISPGAEVDVDLLRNNSALLNNEKPACYFILAASIYNKTSFVFRATNNILLEKRHNTEATLLPQFCIRRTEGVFLRAGCTNLF